MKIICFDFGDKRIGVANSDIGESFAFAGSTLYVNGLEDAVQKSTEAVKQNDAKKIVVGLPKNMDGTEGIRAELCREFADRLKEATGLPVTMWDERRTTVEAHNILSQHNYHGKKRKNTVDAVAASLILEGYLAFRKR